MASAQGNSRNDEALARLKYACTTGDLNQVSRMISTRRDYEYYFHALDFKSPFLYACKGGHLRVVKYFVEIGALMDMMSMQKTMCCFETRDKVVLRYLVNTLDFASSIPSSRPHFLEACSCANVEVVKYLVEKQSHYVAVDCVQVAIQRGQLPTVQFLFERLPTFAHKSLVTRSSVAWACKHGNVDVARWCIEEGHALDLCKAFSWGCKFPGILRLLYEERGLVIPSWLTFVACKNGYLDSLKYLVEDCGVRTDTVHAKGQTLLHAGVQYANVLQYLVETCGLEWNVPDPTYDTLVGRACARRSLPSAKFLVAKGAIINATTFEKFVDKDSTAFAEYVFGELGVDVNTPIANYGTHLHRACGQLFEKVDMVKCLVALGAKIDKAWHPPPSCLGLSMFQTLRRKLGRDHFLPIDLARFREHNRIVKFLQSV